MEIRATDMDEKSDMRREAIEKVLNFFHIFWYFLYFFTLKIFKIFKILKATEFLSSTDIHEESVSRRMKEYFDNNYSPNWHCIIGRIYIFI